jgi:tetratricopeptide (TPR) repeat protein
MTMCARRLITFFLVLFPLSTPALAQSVKGATDESSRTSDEEARNLFKAGKEAYEVGKFQDALTFFEQSFEKSGRVALLYNIGQAADRLRQDDKAIESFNKYLEQTPSDAPNRKDVEARLQALEQARKARDEQQSQEAREVVATAPLPKQTVEQAPIAPAQSNVVFAKPKPRASTSEPVTETWWFWTAVGAAVVAGTATALALTLGGGETVQDPAYQSGNGVSMQGP